MRNILDPL